MIVCSRCRADQAVTNAGGTGLCFMCAHVLGISDQDYGAPAYAGQEAQEAGFFDDVPGPYSLGKKVGEGMKGEGGVSDSIKQGAAAVQSTAQTVKYVVVGGLLVGGAIAAYLIYRGVKLQQHAAHVATETVSKHPELLLGL